MAVTVAVVAIVAVTMVLEVVITVTVVVMWQRKWYNGNNSGSGNECQWK